MAKWKLRCKQKSNKCIVCDIYTSYMYGSSGDSSQIHIKVVEISRRKFDFLREDIMLKDGFYYLDVSQQFHGVG